MAFADMKRRMPPGICADVVANWLLGPTHAFPAVSSLVPCLNVVANRKAEVPPKGHQAGVANRFVV
jgi:hypothetical protein